MIKELQSLGLDVKVLDKNNEEIDLKQTFDDDDDMGLHPMIDALCLTKIVEVIAVEAGLDGYAVEERRNWMRLTMRMTFDARISILIWMTGRYGIDWTSDDLDERIKKKGS